MSITTCVCCGEEIPEGNQVCYLCRRKAEDMSERNPYYNQSGCADPTAYEALKPIIAEENAPEIKVNFLIKVLKYIIRESGFELQNRIEIKDLKTGRTFR